MVAEAELPVAAEEVVAAAVAGLLERRSKRFPKTSSTKRWRST